MYIVQPGRSVGGWPDGQLLLLKFYQGRWNLHHGSQIIDMYIDKKDRRTYGWVEGHISALIQTKGQTDRQTDGRTDEQTIKETRTEVVERITSTQIVRQSIHMVKI